VRDFRCRVLKTASPTTLPSITISAALAFGALINTMKAPEIDRDDETPVKDSLSSKIRITGAQVGLAGL